MKQQTESKLRNVKTLNEYLDVLNSEFKTTECKPSHFIKVTLIYTLVSKLNGTNIVIKEDVKTKATQAKTIQEFIEVIKLNFDCNLNLKDTRDLVKNTKALLILTGLKENDEAQAEEKKETKKISKPAETTKKKLR